MPTFGNDLLEGTSGALIGNQIVGELFTGLTGADTGFIRTVTATLYAFNAGAVARALIYSAAGALLGVSDEQPVLTSAEPITFTFTDTIPFQDVYLMVWGSNGTAISTTFTNNKDVQGQAATYGGTAPQTLTLAVVQTGHQTIMYGTYEAEAPPPNYNINISVTNPQGGTVNPSGTINVLEGTSLSISANAAAGYHILRWLIDGVDSGNGDTVQLDNITQDHTVTVTFELDPTAQFSLEITAGQGGTTNPIGTIIQDVNTTIDVLAIPDTGYVFDHWNVDANGGNGGNGNGGTPQFSALSVQGPNIVNVNNVPVRLRGVNYPSGFTASCAGCFPANGDWLWGAGFTSLSPSALNARLAEMASYDFNFIRLIFNPDWWRNDSATNLNGQTTSIHIREAILQVIQAAQAHNIYVTICPWSSNFDVLSVFGNQNNFVQMWTQAAQLYGQEPNVVFELFNEPAEGSYDAALNAFEAASAAIRQITDSIIVTQWGWCGSFSFVNDFAPRLNPYGNMAFSNHIYRYPAGATFPTNSPTDAGSIDATLRSTWNYNAIITRYPMIIGEIGAWTASGSQESTWFRNALTTLNNYGAGYCGWEWGQDDTNWQLSQPKTAPWTPNTNGQILREAILAGIGA